MIRKAEHKRESGAVLLMVAVMLFLLLGFIAAGVEGGRWFLVRAELSKSVDAAALIAARNLSNPNVNPATLALEYANANFPTGTLGTTGTPTFSVTMLASNKVQVNGATNATSIFAQLLGFGDIPVKAIGVSQKRQVEVMLVLDRSGSMSGDMNNLKSAASKFVDYFAQTQADDKLGLITFATAVKVDRALGNNFVAGMKTAINGIRAENHTNIEDGIDQADGPTGLTDQTGVTPEDRIAQFVVFFSDGLPNAFRSTFVRNGATVDGVVYSDNCNDVNSSVWSPSAENITLSNCKPSGDGKAAGASACPGTSTRWNILDAYPIPGYNTDYCGIPNSQLGAKTCDLASNLSILHAKQLKDNKVIIYTVGLGNDNQTLLGKICSGPTYQYDTDVSSNLKPIFSHIALEIKLRLVQ